MSDDTPALLAVDLGLRSGLAFYARGGRLVSYRSTNFGARKRLKNGAYGVMRDHAHLDRLVLEGGGDFAEIWAKEGERRDATVRIVDAHTWRRALLFPRERRSGAAAKEHADTVARRIISWSDAPAPTGTLRHDVVEAICAGFWGVLDAGWITEIPTSLRR